MSNLDNRNLKRQIEKWALALVTVLGLFYFVGTPWTGGMLIAFPSEFDQKQTANEKLKTMLQSEITNQLQSYNSILSEKLNEKDLEILSAHIAKITRLETRARYGMNSGRNKNAILLDIEFSDGIKVEGLDTGERWNGLAYQPYFLLMANMADGAVTQVLSNGVELKALPDRIQPPIKKITETVLYYGVAKNKLGPKFKKPSEAEVSKAWQ